MVERAVRMCRVFNCDARRGNYCCADCEKWKECENPCLNAPHICGNVAGAKKKGGNEKCKKKR